MCSNTDCAPCAAEAARLQAHGGSAARPKPSSGAKPDELALWAAMEQGEWPRDAGPRLGIPPNRVEYLCLKWVRQGIYDYGVVHDLGWIND